MRPNRPNNVTGHARPAPVRRRPPWRALGPWRPVANAGPLLGNVFCATGVGGGVDPTCSPGGAGGAAGTRAPRNVRVQRGKGVREAATKLFRRDVTDDEIAALASAPDGQDVSVRAAGGRLHIRGGDAREFNSYRVIRRSLFGFGPLVAENHQIKLSGQYKGRGYEVFKEQVRVLQSLGVSKIVASAAGDASGGGSGYAVWPILGWGGAMSSQQVARLPADIRARLGGKRDVRDLFDLEGGRQAWEKHGGSLHVTFDLSPGSRNVRALEAYGRQRAAREGQVTTTNRRRAKLRGRTMITNRQQEEYDRLFREVTDMVDRGVDVDSPEYQSKYSELLLMQQELGLVDEGLLPDDE